MNRAGQDRGAEGARTRRGDDYEYDEAHDVPVASTAPAPNVNNEADGDYGYDEAHAETASRLRETPAQRRVMPAPTTTLDQGGDYGHDEAHDFRTA